jgi:hypothetical protein
MAYRKHAEVRSEPFTELSAVEGMIMATKE